MSDLNDIYLALQEGLGAANALETWQTTADGRDATRSRKQGIMRGLQAYERLANDIKDGRKHIREPEPACDDTPTAANLDVADEGCELCGDCGGDGTVIVGRMYPTGHTEVTEYCETCHGEGQVELKGLTDNEDLK